MFDIELVELLKKLGFEVEGDNMMVEVFVKKNLKIIVETFLKKNREQAPIRLKLVTISTRFVVWEMSDTKRFNNWRWTFREKVKTLEEVVEKIPNCPRCRIAMVFVRKAKPCGVYFGCRKCPITISLSERLEAHLLGKRIFDLRQETRERNISKDIRPGSILDFCFKYAFSGKKS